ncbi:MAG: hypothetical protein J6U69_02505 [Alistipes sp.]|nr:hypothetical protein [Alistipes sp.]
MNNKKPDIKKFIEALESTGGNVSQVAKLLGASRSTINKWVAEDEAFADALSDARGKMFDECLTMSRIVALGIPDKAPDGKIIGWVAPPDSAMLRYLLGTLGRNEGFGEQSRLEVKADVNNNIQPRTLSSEEVEKYIKTLQEEY